MVDILPATTEQWNNSNISSIKLSPTQASLKKNEGYVYQHLLEKTKETPKNKNIDLVRTADLRITFSRGDTTNWSFKLYKITDYIIDTIPRYCNDNLPERCKEALLKKTELNWKEIKDVLKTLNIN